MSRPGRRTPPPDPIETHMHKGMPPVEGTRHVIDYPYAPHDRSVILASQGGPDLPAIPEMTHRYDIGLEREPGEFEHVATVQFQRGPLDADTSQPGVFLTHLLAIEIDFLLRAQRSQFSHPANEVALSHLRAALDVLRERRDARHRAGKLGTHRT